MVISWDVNLWEWVQTLRPSDLPAAPFALRQGVTVVDTTKWLASIQQDARQRVRYGGIHRKMRTLWEMTR